MFGVVGSGNFHVTNALVAAGRAVRAGGARGRRGDDGRRVRPGRPAGSACSRVHQGPGVTNALTGITEAAKSRTPLLVLAPEATSPRSNFFIDLPAAAAAASARGSTGCAPESAADGRGRGGTRGGRRAARWCWGCRWTCRRSRPPRPARRGPAAAARRSGSGAPDDADVAWLAAALRTATPTGVHRRPRRDPAAGAGAGGADPRSPTAAARCSRSPPRRRGSSPATRGTSTSRAASPRRWRPSSSPAPTSWSPGAAR